VTLNPGQTQRVTVSLDERSFQSWHNGWSTTAGSQQILVGASSRDIRLTGAVTERGSGPVVGIQGLCVDVRGATTTDSTPVQIYTCNQSAAQLWTVGTTGALRAYGKCLDVKAGATAEGAPVQLYGCNSSGAQVWQARSDGTLLNPQSGKCLDDPGASTTPGTRLQIATCGATAGQRWTLPS
jgi:beta-glucosidase